MKKGREEKKRPLTFSVLESLASPDSPSAASRRILEKGGNGGKKTETARGVRAGGKGAKRRMALFTIRPKGQ